MPVTREILCELEKVRDQAEYLQKNFDDEVNYWYYGGQVNAYTEAMNIVRAYVEEEEN